MIGTIFVFAITAILVSWYWHRRNKLRLRDDLNIPGPPVKFFAGNLDLMRVSDEERLTLHERMRAKYGDVYGLYQGPVLVVVVHDVDTVKDILIKQFNCFMDRKHFALKDKNSVSAQGLIDLTSDRWRRVRNAVTPVFSSGKLKQMSQIMHEKSEIFMSKMEDNAKSGDKFDIYYAFQALTLDVIGRAAFAFDTNCQRDPNDQFLLRCCEFFNNTNLKNNTLVKFAVIFSELPIWKKLRFLVPFANAENWLIAQLDTVIRRRRETFESFKGMDVMQIMLQQQKEQREQAAAMMGCPFANEISSAPETAQMTDEVILSNALVFLLAGYETTSTALGFTAYCLATNSEVQKELQAEIDRKLKEKNKSHLDYDELMKEMPYLDAVFHESLRLYPPVHGFVNRTCIEDCVVNGTRFLPGMEVLIPVYAIHRDPKLWEEPEAYKPERFLGGHSHHPMSWLPFGSGPRNCIGLRFAELEYKMALTKLLSKYNILPSFDVEAKLPLVNTSILIRPKDGVMVKLTER